VAAVRRARGQRGRAPVGAAVLALVIEKPSYGYEVWQRFEQRFGGLLEVGSSRIYQVVNSLLDEGMIEQVPGESAGSRRQPKPSYRATALGMQAHREWLAEELREDPLRIELRRRLLAVSANDASTLLEIVDRYEQACLDEMAELGASGRPAATAVRDVRDRLIAEERRLVLEARLKWILFARRQLQTSAGSELGELS
jgi:DNA-binding PadR family transcriptional regulator